MAGTLTAFYNRIVNALSFSTDYQKLRRLLNTRIDNPSSREELPPSHPAGFVRELKKRRISIVEAYLTIIRDLESEHHRERIHSLRLLEEETFHAKNLTMPLNTARVQLALMKEAIKSRDNKRRQLELLYDFTVSSYGQPSVIRACLAELGVIELPETGARIADMDMGWDLHVHDNSSYGRKTSSQLVIDGFIKGISEITVAFNQLNTVGNIEEVLAAGEILGVRINVGVEFSVLTQGHRFHFMFLLPPLRSAGELESFSARHGESLRFFIDGLNRNQESRIASIHALIDNFNTVHLPALNDGYDAQSMYALPALDLESIDEIVPMESLNRMYLGELLYARWKPVLLKRVLLAKSKVNHARAELDRGRISQWDYANIELRYHTLRETYTQLNPEVLRAHYFGAPQLSEYPTVFEDVEAVCGPLKAAGGRVKILHPLEHGLPAAYKVILANARWIDFVEVYNVYDSVNRAVDDIVHFARFVNSLNSGQPALVRPFLAGHSIDIEDGELARILGSIAERPLVPVCGSDSTGKSSTIPGMGFIFASRVPPRHRQHYLDRHFALPELVSRIIAARGAYVSPADEAGPHDPLISMGKTTHFIPNKVGDENHEVPVPLRRAVRYLNPLLRNLIFIARGIPHRHIHHRVEVRPGVVRHHEPAARHRGPARPARLAGEGMEPEGNRLPQHRPIPLLDGPVGADSRLREVRFRRSLAAGKDRALLPVRQVLRHRVRQRVVPDHAQHLERVRQGRDGRQFLPCDSVVAFREPRRPTWGLALHSQHRPGQGMVGRRGRSDRRGGQVHPLRGAHAARSHRSASPGLRRGRDGALHSPPRPALHLRTRDPCAQLAARDLLWKTEQHRTSRRPAQETHGAAPSAAGGILKPCELVQSRGQLPKAL